MTWAGGHQDDPTNVGHHKFGSLTLKWNNILCFNIWQSVTLCQKASNGSSVPWLLSEATLLADTQTCRETCPWSWLRCPKASQCLLESLQDSRPRSQEEWLHSIFKEVKPDVLFWASVRFFLFVCFLCVCLTTGFFFNFLYWTLGDLAYQNLRDCTIGVVPSTATCGRRGESRLF